MQEFNLKVMDRREVVRRMEQLLGICARFMRGQGFSYQIGAYTITRDNILIAPDEAIENVLQTLINEDMIEYVQEEPMEVSVHEPEATVEETVEISEIQDDLPQINTNIKSLLILPNVSHNGLTLQNFFVYFTQERV